jgi:hypothetical protein
MDLTYYDIEANEKSLEIQKINLIHILSILKFTKIGGSSNEFFWWR